MNTHKTHKSEMCNTDKLCLKTVFEPKHSKNDPTRTMKTNPAGAKAHTQTRSHAQLSVSGREATDRFYSHMAPTSGLTQKLFQD